MKITFFSTNTFPSLSSLGEALDGVSRSSLFYYLRFVLSIVPFKLLTPFTERILDNTDSVLINPVLIPMLQIITIGLLLVPGSFFNLIERLYQMIFVYCSNWFTNYCLKAGWKKFNLTLAPYWHEELRSIVYDNSARFIDVFWVAMKDLVENYNLLNFLLASVFSAPFMFIGINFLRIQEIQIVEDIVLTLRSLTVVLFFIILPLAVITVLLSTFILFSIVNLFLPVYFTAIEIIYKFITRIAYKYSKNFQLKDTSKKTVAVNSFIFEKIISYFMGITMLSMFILVTISNFKGSTYTELSEKLTTMALANPDYDFYVHLEGFSFLRSIVINPVEYIVSWFSSNINAKDVLNFYYIYIFSPGIFLYNVRSIALYCRSLYYKVRSFFNLSKFADTNFKEVYVGDKYSPLYDFILTNYSETIFQILHMAVLTTWVVHSLSNFYQYYIGKLSPFLIVEKYTLSPFILLSTSYDLLERFMLHLTRFINVILQVQLFTTLFISLAFIGLAVFVYSLTYLPASFIEDENLTYSSLVISELHALRKAKEDSDGLIKAKEDSDGLIKAKEDSEDEEWDEEDKNLTE